MIDFRYDPAGLNDLLASGGPIERELRRRGHNVESRAKQASPVDTGRLRSDIAVTAERDGNLPVVFVGSDVDYAVYAHRSGEPAHHWLLEGLQAASE